MKTSDQIIPLHSELAAATKNSLALVGGKGVNLARLARTGFPVPEGFIVTTQAYRDFVKANGLNDYINNVLPETDHPEMEILELVSKQIRSSFSKGRVSPGLKEELLRNYHALNYAPVAVRSSATVEDLPDISFAGQQDTYLNVQGDEALLKAVVDCWSSLWTARAIAYRFHNHVPHRDAALAVVVQRMVESRSSGVLFTANPLTGLRKETVIDATIGLGEALVSGQVEPDHFIIDTEDNKIIVKKLGTKTVSLHGQSGGGTYRINEDRKGHQSLSDAQILTLAQIGQSVAEKLGSPQDIEWACVNERLYLLQSRAITALFPIPENIPAKPLKVFFSFSAVQGLLDPVTPVGCDTLKIAFAAAAGLFGIRVTPQTQNVIYTAGERLWINMTTLFRNSVGRKVMHVALDFIEPTLKQALLTLWDEPGLLPERQGIRPHAMSQLAGGFLPILGNIILNLISPRQRRQQIVANGEHVLEMMHEHAAGLQGSSYERLAAAADLLPDLAHLHLPRTLRQFISVVAGGMVSLNMMRVTAGYPADSDSTYWSDLLLEATRGLPHNPTTEMNLALWATAKTIRLDPVLLSEFQSADARSLAKRFRAEQLPPTGQALIGGFLARYGGRGLGEIDLGRERWSEDPTHVFEVLSSYLQIERPEMAPDIIFAKSESAALEAINRLAEQAGRHRCGWLRVRLFRFFTGRMRALLGARESPKFFIVRMFDELRKPLLNIGRELVQTGDLARPDDHFYLTFDEMKKFAQNRSVAKPIPAEQKISSIEDWKKLIADRREANRRETARRQIPRLLLSDGRAFYEGIQPPAGIEALLTGSPVSPGCAEGMVRVVLDPRCANLKPGEILVCPGTDPSWTPLFFSAAGLVMEVGGMMTHGAVVAREFGIPAIVGVDQATCRLTTGQKIRIDGSSGVIEIIE